MKQIDPNTRLRTIAQADQVLRNAGIEESVDRGNGYVYFYDGLSHEWPSSSIPVCYLNHLTAGQLLEWHARLKADYIDRNK